MSWRKYWHAKEFVKTESGRFCVYHGGSRDSKASVVLLHGAGYSGLTWSTLGENLASQIQDCWLWTFEVMERLKSATRREVRSLT